MNADRIIVLENEHGNIESSLQFVLQKQICRSARILDIGCRYGSLIYNLFRQGYHHVFGLDVSAKTIERGKQAYRDISGNLATYDGKELPYEDESFDVILMFDVIEHIPAVDRYLKNEVYRVLKKGGLLLFQTPNKYINIPWEIWSRRSLTGWKRNHCSLQTRRSLKQLLLGAGFSRADLEKHTILTGHNRTKVQKHLGKSGLLLLHLFAAAPFSLYPNFWGTAVK